MFDAANARRLMVEGQVRTADVTGLVIYFSVAFMIVRGTLLYTGLSQTPTGFYRGLTNFTVDESPPSLSIQLRMTIVSRTKSASTTCSGSRWTSS